jgi:predicted Zn-dependent protease
MHSWSRIAVASLLTTAGCSVSQDREVEIGKENAQEIESQVPIVHDTAIDRFISELGNSMASRTRRADLDWHFTLVNSPEVNAFALPGGFVYVNRGAIEQADRLDELAGIMGHEIGHVVRRHGVEQMEKRKRGEVGLLFLCTLTPACRTIGGRVAVDVGANALSAHYSQVDEAQADSEGVLNTVHAGIDPEGLPSFFQDMLNKQKVQPSAVEAFFSTHPTDQARVTATRRQIEHLDPKPAPGLTRDTPEFHAIQARVRALPPPPADTAARR